MHTKHEDQGSKGSKDGILNPAKCWSGPSLCNKKRDAYYRTHVAQRGLANFSLSKNSFAYFYGYDDEMRDILCYSNLVSHQTGWGA